MDHICFVPKKKEKVSEGLTNVDRKNLPSKTYFCDGI